MQLRDKKFYFIIACIAFIKLWLMWDLELFAIPLSPHDDMLFLKHASSFYEEGWFGKYDNLTLAKGLFYPCYIALNHLLGLPLLLSQHIFYLFACLLVIIVAKKYSQNDLLLIGLFVLVAFNPILVHAGMRRISREGVSTTLAILTLFFFFKTIINYEKDRRAKQYIAALLTGIFFTFFWHNREDGIWLLPALLMAGGYGILKEYFQNKKITCHLGMPLVITFGIFAVLSMLLAWKNQKEYSVFTTVETKNAEFVSAYGALVRVNEFERMDFIPVTKKTRLLLYEKIPSFGELKDLEYVFDAWTVHNQNCTEGDSACLREVGGGHFIWALRDVVALKGYYFNGAYAKDYYRRLATEINEACDCGKLKCLPERNTMLPPVSDKQKTAFVQTFFSGWKHCLNLEEYTTDEPPYFPGNEQDINLIKKITRNKIQHPEELRAQHQGSLAEKKRKMLAGIGQVYVFIVPILFFLALACAAFNFIKSCLKKSYSFYMMISVVLLTACAGRIALLALVDATSFDAINLAYLSPVYALIYLFIFFSIAETIQTIKNRNIHS